MSMNNLKLIQKECGCLSKNKGHPRKIKLKESPVFGIPCDHQQKIKNPSNKG